MDSTANEKSFFVSLSSSAASYQALFAVPELGKSPLPTLSPQDKFKAGFEEFKEGFLANANMVKQSLEVT